jgi:predicted GH43/DUF377 family glycosyl hydrolase
MKTPSVLMVLLAVVAFSDTANPFLSWTRVSKTPILTPRGNGFEAAGVFNPSVVKRGNEYVMIYRAQDWQGTSRLGYAESADAIHFTRDKQPVLSPEAPYERGGGVEDPRIVRIGDSYFLTYTAYNRVDAQLALAKSPDLRRWKRLGVILPANRGRWNVHWTKSGAILNQKVNGHYWMYFMGDAPGGGANQMGVAYSDDLIHWHEPLDHPVLGHRAGMFDSQVVEPGPPPVLTSRGILLIYNGANDQLMYHTGWALFDRANPARVIARSQSPIFGPEEVWEKTGQVPNVVFVSGLVVEPRRWLFYYGAADKSVGVAAAQPAWH